MNFLRKLSVKRKVLMAVCAILACLAIVAGLSFSGVFTQQTPVNGADGANISDGSHTIKKVSLTVDELKPYREYNALNSAQLYNQNVVVYANKTTAEDLKQNLEVKGSFNGKEFNLAPNEYALSVKIKDSETPLLNDGDILYKFQEGAQLDESVTIVVNCGNLKINIADVNVTKDEIPKFTAIKINEDGKAIIGSASSDHTKDSLKSLFSVYGLTEGGDYVQIYNRELYNIDSLDTLTPDATDVAFSVKYGNLQSVNGKILRVTRAKIIAADFSVNSSYIKEGTYWQKPVEEDGKIKWFSAFVANASAESVYKDGLVLTVYYENKKSEVDFDGMSFTSGNIEQAKSGEYIYFQERDFSAGDRTVSVGVRTTEQDIEGQITASIQISFEAYRIVEIKAEGYEQNITIYPYTSATANNIKRIFDGHIFTRGNSGVWNTSAVNFADYAVSGSFSPTFSDIDKENYPKEITITYNPDKNLTAVASLNVTAAEFQSLGNINLREGDSNPEQTYFSPFNFGLLRVQLNYAGGNNVQAPLAEFKDKPEHFDIKYYSDDDCINLQVDSSGKAITVLNKDTRVVCVRFRYDINSEEWTNWYKISASDYELVINEYIVQFPNFDAKPETLSEPIVKTINLGNLPDEVKNNIAVKITDENGIDVTEGENPKVKHDIATGEIEFSEGGLDYKVIVTIDKNIKDYVKFAAYTNEQYLSRDNDWQITYTVTINKGKLQFSVSYNESSWVYGNSSAPLLNATIKGVTNSGDKEYTIKNNGTESGNIIVMPYKLTFYPISLLDGSSETVTVLERLDENSLKAGTYYVVATITETDKFVGGTTPQSTGLQAPIITVKPAPLSPDTLMPDIIYDGEGHDAKDFFTASGIVKGDKVGNIIDANTLKCETSNISLVNGKAKNAAEYSVILEIINKNYKWNDEGENKVTTVAGKPEQTKKTFEIKKRELELQIANSQTDLSFIYGGEKHSNVLDRLPTPDLRYCIDYNTETQSGTFYTLTELGNTDINTVPNISVKADTLFFAQIKGGKPKYYKVEVDTSGSVIYEDGKPKKGEEVLEEDFAEWDAGEYVVVYTTALKTGDTLTTNYSLPTAEQTFTIHRKTIDKVTSSQDSTSADYDRNTKTITLDNWTANNGQDNAGTENILNWSLSANYFNKNGEEQKNSTDLTKFTLFNGINENNSTYGLTFDRVNGTVGVTHAGVYKLTVTLNSNYKWGDKTVTAEDGTSTTTDDTEPITITYTVNQAVMQAQATADIGNSTFKWHTGQENDYATRSFMFNNTAQFLIPSTIGIAAQGTGEDNIQLSVKYYGANTDGDIDSSKELEAKNIISSGAYYVVIDSWTVKDLPTGDYDVANNYKFPDSSEAVKLCVKFTIDSADLEKPTIFGFEEAEISGNTITVEYCGQIYDFVNYISDYDVNSNNGFAYGNNQHKIEVLVVKGESNNAVTNITDKTKMLDVCTYTAYVYPATNFQWGDEAKESAQQINTDGIPADTLGFTFTFNITPKTLNTADIEWGTVQFTYNGKVQEPSPKIKTDSLLNKENDTNSTVKLSVEKTAGTSTDFTMAGEYTAKIIFATDSTRAFNYKFGSDITNTVKIKQATLKAPTLADLTGTFNNEAQTKNVTFSAPTTDVYGFKWSDVVEPTIVGGWKIGESKIENGKHEAELTLPENASGTGLFSFINAGYYNVSFSIKTQHQNNYKWVDESQNVIELQTIEISAKDITAPALGSNRTIVYNGEKQKPVVWNTDLINGKTYITCDGIEISFDVNYSSYTNGFNDINNTVSEGFVEYGKYYIQLKINNENPLNFNWVENTEDTEGRNILNLNYDGYTWGTTKYENNNVSVFLAYVITKTILKVDFTVNEQYLNNNGTFEYIFGANAHLTGDENIDKIVQSAIDGSNIDSSANFIHLLDKNDFEIVKTNFERVEIKFINKDTRVELEESELENGLPWNVGNYTVEIKIFFSETNTQYDTIPLEYNLVVKARPIKVTWTAGTDSKLELNSGVWHAVYDGVKHMPGAEVANAPQRKENVQAFKPELSVSSDKTVLNADTYTLGVAFVDTTQKNFIIDGSVENSNTTATLVINKRAITVQITTSISGVVYGSNVNYGDANWACVDNTEIVEADKSKNIITYALKKSEADTDYLEINADTILDAGTYILVPILANNNDAMNYALSVAQNGTGTYEIVPREIVVSLNEDASATYTEGVTIDDADITISWANKEGSADSNWLVGEQDKTNVFTLGLFKVDGTNVTKQPWLPVDTYTVKLTKADNSNYKVKIGSDVVENGNSQELGEFKITPATLKSLSVTQKEPVTYKAGNYSIIGDLINATAETYNVQSVKWYWADKSEHATVDTPEYGVINNSVWAEITNETRKNVFSGEYWILAVAENHNPEVSDNPVKVEIKQATLTLSVNFIGDNAIFYGEAAPILDTDANVIASNQNNIFATGKKQEGAEQLINDLLTGDKLDNIGLKGTFGFSVETYSAGYDVKNYTTKLTVDNLTSNNYKIDWVEGTLQVKALPVTVTITSSDIYSYMDNRLIGKPVSEILNSYTIVVDTTKTNGKNLTIPEADKNNIISLKTTALIIGDNGKINATNNVNIINGSNVGYPLYAIEGDCFANYKCEIFVDGGKWDSTVSEAIAGSEIGIFIIKTAENSLTLFDFEGSTEEKPLVFSDGNISNYAWIYGANDGIIQDGFAGIDESSKHKLVLPVATLNSIPGETSTNVIKYTLYIKDTVADSWKVVGNGENLSEDDLINLFNGAGAFSAGIYKLYYEMQGNANYDTVSDERYFKIAQRTLYVWAKSDMQVYYGEAYTFSESDVDHSAIANGANLTDILSLEFVCDYSAGKDVTDNGYEVTVTEGSQGIIYNNYIIKRNFSEAEQTSEFTGKLTVLPRPVEITIADSLETRYDLNKSANKNLDTLKQLTYTAKLGEPQVGLEFKNNKPFFNLDKTQLTNDDNIVLLYTSAFIYDTDGIISENETAKYVGDYPIFAVYANQDIAKNYVITVSNNYSIDADKEVAVKKFFGETDGLGENYFSTLFVDGFYDGLNLAIGKQEDGTYKAGTYKIIPADLNISLGNTVFTFNGEPCKIAPKPNYSGSNDYNSGSVSAKYKQNGEYVEEPVNVGIYDIEITIENPNYAPYNEGTITPQLTINRQLVTGTIKIDSVGDSLAIGDIERFYKGENYSLILSFDSTVSGHVLNFALENNRVSPEKLADIDGYNFANNNNFKPFEGLGQGEFLNGKFELNVKNAGIYTITLTLTGANENNYTFNSSTTGYSTTNEKTIEFTFTIKRAELDVTAKNSTIQYGTEYNINGFKITEGNIERFAGFALSDEVVQTLNKEPSGFAEYNDITYSVPNYSAGNNSTATTVGAQGLNIVPAGVLAYNYNINYNQGTNFIGELNVIRRDINVKILGANDENVAAKYEYDGTNPKNYLTDNVIKLIVPVDSVNENNSWYGCAESDKDDILNALRLSLKISESAIDVGLYTISATQNIEQSNYSITFTNSSGTELKTLTQTAAEQPKFEIYQARLTVTIGWKGAGENISDNDFRNFKITYGNVITDYFDVRYNGWKNGENYSKAEKIKEGLFYSALNGSDKIYAPWESHANEEYKIDLDTTKDGLLAFKNYYIVTNKATMTVVPRYVTASISNRTYTEIKNGSSLNYNGGVSGIQHFAPITFTDSNRNAINNPGIYDKYDINGFVLTGESIYAGTLVDGLPKYSPNRYLTLTYGIIDGRGLLDNENLPVGAGTYQVVLALRTNGLSSGVYDFLFDDNAQTGTKNNATITDKEITFDYTVRKKYLNIGWEFVDDGYLAWTDGADKERSIDGFIKDIMQASLVQRRRSGKTETLDPVTNISELTGGKYYVGSNILTLKIYGTGEYSAVIIFNEAARNNYTWDEEYAWDENDAVVKNNTILFSVAANFFTIKTLTIEGWIYKDEAKMPVFELSNDVKKPLTFYYTSLASLPSDFDYFGSKLSDEIIKKYDLPTEGGSTVVPTDAGYYLLRAHFAGDDDYENGYASVSAYCVFKIEQKAVSAPEFLNKDSKFVYTSKQLQTSIKYSSAILSFTYSGLSSISAEEVTLFAVDADTYKISFNIIDNKNYKWADGTKVENGAVVLEWVINPADDNEVTSFDTGMLDDVTYNGSKVALPRAEAKYDNSGIIIEFFIDNEWSQDIPENAGKYKVRAVSPATGNYYAGTKDTAAYSEEIPFVIKRAKLTVTPAGTAVYGTAFNENGGVGYTLSFIGFVAGELKVSGTAKYSLTNKPATLVVDKYGLTLETLTENEADTIDGLSHVVVKGLELENYYIEVAEGVFTVTQKQLSAVVNNVYATYGDKFDLSKAEISLANCEFAYDDNIASLAIELGINNPVADPEAKKYEAGAHPMKVETYNNDNYEVTFLVIGSYVVAPLDIQIEIETVNGEYNTKEAVARVNSVTANGKPLGDINGIVVPQFTFIYYGTSNDGKWSHTESENYTSVPTSAGTYTAKAVGTYTKNFNLVNTPAKAFTVEKFTVDASKIKTVNGVYVNSPLTPVIEDNEYADLYTVTPVTYTDVGTWNVTLVLKDFFNYKWQSVDVAERVIPYTIDKGTNSFIKDADGNEVTIKGWLYGQTANAPTAKSLYGNASDFIFEYSDAKDGTYSTSVPVNAETWWVRVTAPQSDNYLRAVSEPVSFVIGKAPLAAPALTFVAEGEGQNAVYTGERLSSSVSGFNPNTMRIVYNGDISSAGSAVTVFALNAGTYKVLIALNDAKNYCWNENVKVEDGNAVLTWTIARMKLNKPTGDSKLYMVNGGTLTYMPEGFDENTMAIEGNTTSYGGVYKVTVSIKDKVNYEWFDSTTDDITFDWTVVGWDTVFVIVVSVLGVVAGIAAIAIGVQYLVHRNKKKKEALQAAAASQMVADVVANNVAASEGAEGVQGEQPAEAEQPEQTENSAEAEQPEQLEQTENPAETEQPAETENSTETEQPEAQSADGENTDGENKGGHEND